MTLDYFKNRGNLFINRALIQGRRELAFSDTIKKHVERGRFFNNDEEFHLQTALTTFQWLTTNVGTCVLTGRKIVAIKD